MCASVKPGSTRPPPASKSVVAGPGPFARLALVADGHDAAGTDGYGGSAGINR
jgi:hypothetical protein